jgi:sulfoquinovosyltransferase
MRQIMIFGDHDDGPAAHDTNNDSFLLHVARLAHEKRLVDLKAILERMPNLRLCIVGHGPQKVELQEYFKGTKTVFLGHLSGMELSEAFASADVFVMPSDSETLGFVFMESMAPGVPVGMLLPVPVVLVH